MGLSIRQLVRQHSEIGIILIAILLVMFFSTTSFDRWATAYNLASIAQITATLGLLALGASLVMGTGEIDISVGSTFGIGALVYLGTVATIGPLPAMLLAAAAGAAIGLFNGFIVTRFGVSSLLLTLSTLLVFRGVAVALTDGFSFSVPYGERSGFLYQLFGGGDFLGVNTGFWWLILGLAVLMVFLYATPGGSRLLAVGGSAESARSRGIRVTRVKVRAFIICGVLAALAGTLEGGKLGFADGGMGRLMELQAIAACVLGGCALLGGRVSLVGVVVGAFVLSAIQSYLVVNGVRPQWFMLLLGVIVVAAAISDRHLRDWALRSR
ncbi:ribose ABC transporter [Halomonas heilongjiangensis]|uniref:ABC transporter permease n=2 Tax=Halomonas heilongjiangensis TaxID=1387883 RepID=A0A2N7TKB1_9GAMM|nr:ABC transporter permease [Halomonas heilongjiangensis]PXX89249.1 ribose ABC transporter [Halomonas heilongjiangensis]